MGYVQNFPLPVLGKSWNSIAIAICNAALPLKTVVLTLCPADLTKNISFAAMP
jgi:hypothetical protein